MDILIISKYILIIAFIIMMFAALRASAYKGTSMGLLGSSVVVVAFAVALLQADLELMPLGYQM